MNFSIKNENNFIKFEKVDFYDDSQDYEFIVNAKCESFIIQNKTIWVNKNEFLNFYKKMQSCYENLKGELVSEFEYDTDIKLKLSFNELGHVVVECDFFSYGGYTCKCHIEFGTDQTFIAETLKEIKEILV